MSGRPPRSRRATSSTGRSKGRRSSFDRDGDERSTTSRASSPWAATPWPTNAGFRGGSVFVGDSSYFVALADRKDRWHRDAVRLKKGLSEGFVVTDCATLVLMGRRRIGTIVSFDDDFDRVRGITRLR